MNIPISILLCLVFTMVTGTIAYAVFEVIRKVNKDTKVLKTHYILLKAVVIAFLVPFCFVLEITLNYSDGLWRSSLFTATPTLLVLTIIILCVWSCGAVIRIFKWAKEAKIYRLSLQLYTETQEYSNLFFDVKQKLYICKDIRIQVGEYYESPFYTGLIHPRLCLPMSQFSENELKHIFMHELIHYKHRDVWFLGMIKILETVYWFHPAFRKKRLFSQYRELMEDACDIEVCGHVTEYRSYVQVLIRMILKNTNVKYTVPAFLSESYDDVMRRIDNMEKYRSQKSIKRIVVTMLIAAVFCGSSVMVYAAESGISAGYEKAYDATWVGLEEEINGNTENVLEEVYELAVEDSDITVEYITEEIAPYSTAYHVDYSISANAEKRKSSTHALKAGDKVLVSLTVTPDNKNVRVGFYMSNGYVRYISGSGNIYHTFTIYDNDNYRFFIQNNNSTAVDIDGYYSIQ